MKNIEVWRLWGYDLCIDILRIRVDIIASKIIYLKKCSIQKIFCLFVSKNIFCTCIWKVFYLCIEKNIFPISRQYLEIIYNSVMSRFTEDERKVTVRDCGFFDADECTSGWPYEVSCDWSRDLGAHLWLVRGHGGRGPALPLPRRRLQPRPRPRPSHRAADSRHRGDPRQMMELLCTLTMTTCNKSYSYCSALTV